MLVAEAASAPGDELGLQRFDVELYGPDEPGIDALERYRARMRPVHGSNHGQAGLAWTRVADAAQIGVAIGGHRGSFREGAMAGMHWLSARRPRLAALLMGRQQSLYGPVKAAATICH